MAIDPNSVVVDEPKGIDPSSVTLDPEPASLPVPRHQDPALQEAWAKGSPVDRIKMMIPWMQTGALSALWNETPVKPIATAALTGVGTALGAAGGEIVGGPVGMVAGGAAGGAAGNAAAQRIDMAVNPGTQFKLGEMAGAAFLGSVPMGSLAGAAKSTVAANAIKFAGAGVGAKTAETAIDENRLPTAAEAAIAAGAGAIAAPLAAIMDSGSTTAAKSAQKALMAVRDETVKDARAAGYIIPSARINPSKLNTVLESYGGKAATEQEAAIRNQDVTNALAAKAIGLPKDEPITPAAIQQVRDAAGKAYEAVASLSQDAHDTLEALKRARYEKNLQYKWYQRSGNPDALKAAEVSGQAADDLELSLEKMAAGKPKLVDDMREARRLIAKTYQVEGALNAANGNVSASEIAKSFGPKTPLTDELALIGRFNSAFAKVSRDAERVPSPGVGKTKAFGSVVLSDVGTHLAGPIGTALGAVLPFYDSAARNVALSRMYQNSSLAAPNYGMAMPELQANIARFSAQNLGQQPNVRPFLNNQ